MIEGAVADFKQSRADSLHQYGNATMGASQDDSEGFLSSNWFICFVTSVFLVEFVWFAESSEQMEGCSFL